MSAPIVSVADLRIHFPTQDRRETVKAVDGVSFDVLPGETFGIIGESGSGKSTLGRAVVCLLKPTEGQVKLGRRKELAAIEDTAERIATYERFVAELYDIGKALNTGSHFQVDDVIDPAVGVILDVKMGAKVDGNTVLCRLYYRDDANVEEAAELVEDAFRISASAPEERELILEVVS